jgi:hypothetical protein
MTLTKSEYDAALARAAWMDPAYRALARALGVLFWPLAWPVTRIGAVRRAIGRTIGGRAEAIFRCQRRGRHERAVALALDALKAVRRPPGQSSGQSNTLPANQSNHWASHHQWWEFMSYAVASLEQCDAPEAWDEAMALARHGMEPFQGYAVAYAFLAFARRKLAVGDDDAATAFAIVAGHADETWGEPEFLLGWYELASGQGDGMAPLSRAVRKDPRILTRIADDPTCRQHPDLIAKLEGISDQ